MTAPENPPIRFELMVERPKQVITRNEWIALACLAFAAVAFRFIQIGQESLWIDEVWSLRALDYGVFRWIWDIESTPPLFFLLLKAWRGIFGSSPEALRGFSAMLGGLAAPALYVCARVWGLGRRIAASAGLLMALHPFAYWMSQQNRYYMLMMLGGIVWLATLPAVLLPLQDRPWHRRIAWSFVAVGFACWATHYYFSLFALAVGVGALLWWAIASRRFAALGSIVMNFAVMGAAMGLLLPLFLHQRSHAPDSFLHSPTWTELWEVFSRYNWVGAWVWEGHWHWPFPQPRVRGIIALSALALAGYAWQVLRTVRRPLRERPTEEREWMAASVVFFCGFVLATLASFAYSRAIQPIFIGGRYPILFLPTFLLWLCIGWGLWPRRLRGGVLALGVAGCAWLGMASVATYWGAYQDFDWRGAIRVVDEEWQEGDAMVFCPDWNLDNYVNNGGKPRNVLGPHDLARIEGARRAWLFIWEQAPDPSGRPGLQALRERRGATMLIELPQMTFSRIEPEDTSGTKTEHSEAAAP